jgi:hypothetical protein
MVKAEISRLDPAVRIRSSQVQLLGTVLTRAFYDNPGVMYVLPDPELRRSVLSWFFASVVLRTSRLCGEAYTTVNVDGAALWICPGVDLTIGHAVRMEMSSLPFKVDRSSLTRWLNVHGHLESIRRRLAGPHWYLVALGTEPSIRDTAVRRSLIAPVLAKADWELQPCYVETFHAEDLPVYEQCGFEIAGAGVIPKGGPTFWSLIRPPGSFTTKNLIHFTL